MMVSFRVDGWMGGTRDEDSCSHLFTPSIIHSCERRKRLNLKIYGSDLDNKTVKDPGSPLACVEFKGQTE